MASILLLSACQLRWAGTTYSNFPPHGLPNQHSPSDHNAPAEQGGTAGSERASSVDGMPQVHIPDGTFRMGGWDAM